jgi:predicted lactoylglutathione lyase
MDIRNHEAVANLAVKNLKRAREFYEKVLELQPIFEMPEVITYQSGPSKLNVYQSEFAGTNQATAVTWSVGERLEQVVEELKERGVNFEHYKMDGMEEAGDIYKSDKMRVAWFKDPDGNILNLTN